MASAVLVSVAKGGDIGLAPIQLDHHPLLFDIQRRGTLDMMII